MKLPSRPLNCDFTAASRCCHTGELGEVRYLSEFTPTRSLARGFFLLYSTLRGSLMLAQSANLRDFGVWSAHKSIRATLSQFSLGIHKKMR